MCFSGICERTTYLKSILQNLPAPSVKSSFLYCCSNHMPKTFQWLWFIFGLWILVQCSVHWVLHHSHWTFKGEGRLIFLRSWVSGSCHIMTQRTWVTAAFLQMTVTYHRTSLGISMKTSCYRRMCVSLTCVFGFINTIQAPAPHLMNSLPSHGLFCSVYITKV